MTNKLCYNYCNNSLIIDLFKNTLQLAPNQ